ncbi:MAG: threonine synthase, partial [Anaerolineaceae bacterium]
PQTGVALGAAQKLAAQGTIRQNERVVVISTANGLKFSKIKKDYHTGKMKGINFLYKNIPIETEASIDKLLNAINL